jgi:hypothetical protein
MTLSGVLPNTRRRRRRVRVAPITSIPPFSVACSTNPSATVCALRLYTCTDGAFDSPATGVPYLRWIRENGRGACLRRPISAPIPLAARMLAFDALTMLKMAPVTMSDRPIGPYAL